MTESQKFSGGEYVNKARDAAKDNPDQARNAIDKVQDAVNQRTGGKFGSLIDKAGDFVEDKLGLPQDTAAGDEPSGDTPSVEEPAADKPTPKAPEPSQDSAPRETGQPGTAGGGVLPG